MSGQGVRLVSEPEEDTGEEDFMTFVRQRLQQFAVSASKEIHSGIVLSYRMLHKKIDRTLESLW